MAYLTKNAQKGTTPIMDTMPKTGTDPIRFFHDYQRGHDSLTTIRWPDRLAVPLVQLHVRTVPEK